MKAKNVLCSYRTPVRVGLLLAALGGVSLSHAGVQTANGFQDFMVRVTGNSATVGFGSGGVPVATKAPTALGGTSGWSSAPNWGVGSVGGKAVVGQLGDVALTGGKVGVTLASTIGKGAALSAFGRSIGALAGGPAGVALLVLPFMLDQIAGASQSASVQRNSDPATMIQKPFTVLDESLMCFPNASQTAQLEAELQPYLPGYGGFPRTRYTKLLPSGVCDAGYDFQNTNNGVTIRVGMITFPPNSSASFKPANWDEVRPKFESANFDLAPLVKAQLDAREKAQKNGFDYPWSVEVESTKVTGPAVAPPITTSEKTTRLVTGPDGITRTEETTKTTTTVRPVTYTDDGVRIAPQETTTTTTKLTNPDGSSTTKTDTETTVKDTDKPAEEDDSDLCKLHPDILACAKPELDTPDGEIPKENKTITYQEENLFGSGSCPANAILTLGTTHQQVTVWDWTKTCEYALPLRGLVVSLAGFAAFLIVMPGSTRV